MRHSFTRIIEAKAAFGCPYNYFATTERMYGLDVARMLKAGWRNIRVAQILDRDPKLMSALNHCSLGSKNEEKYLQLLFIDNMQYAEEYDIEDHLEANHDEQGTDHQRAGTAER